MVSEAGPQAVELAEAAAEGMDRARGGVARRAARRAFEEAMMDYDEEVGGGRTISRHDVARTGF